MQIVVATLLHEHGPTGVQTHFGTLRRHLDERKITARTLTPYSSRNFLLYPIFAVRRLLDPWWGTASVAWYQYWHAYFLEQALRRLCADRQPRVIYAQCPPSARAALDARSTPEQRVVMVVHFNGSQAEEWHEKGKIALDGWLARRIRNQETQTLSQLDGVVFVSQYMRELLRSRIPSLAEVSQRIIPNFCDRPVLLASTPRFDLINIGTLEPRKNQQFLLHVLAAAREHGHCYSLALVGDGPDRAKLEALAQTLQIAGQVHFLGFQPNAARLLPQAKVYAHAATIENLPMAIIEALAHGLPVLAPKVGGIPDLFEDGREGFFWPHDPAVAAPLLIALLEDPSRYADRAAAARQRFESRYRTEVVAEELLQFLLQVTPRIASMTQSASAVTSRASV